MSAFVLNRNPNHWADCNEIWHKDGPQGWEGSWQGFDPLPPTPRLWGA